MTRDLLDSNRRWAEEMVRTDPDFFRRQVGGQAPTHLWIGCSDSRVPAAQLLGVQPGDVFVHRNIANQAAPSDLSSQAVIEFAVNTLGVREIVVCGHSGCGGVRAAYDGGVSGVLGEWLSPLVTIRSWHAARLDRLAGEEMRLRALAHLNVIHQVRSVAISGPVAEAWKAGVDLSVRGWMYEIGTGRLRDVGCTVRSPDSLDRSIEDATERCFAGEGQPRTG